MQMIDTGSQLQSKRTVCKRFWTQSLMMSFLLSVFSSKASDELCFVSVEMRGTNLIYYVAEPKGGVNLSGVANYIDKCVSYASTNLCVHVRIGSEVLFKHVASLIKMCQARNLSRVIFYWPDKRNDGDDDMSNFAFLYIHVFDNVSARRISPFIGETAYEVIKPSEGRAPP